MGDVAFTFEGLAKIKSLNVKSKVLILGNHDLERGIKIKHVAEVYDKVFSLHSRRHVWFTHCPIHPSEMRDRIGNIHGHKHDRVINDPRYFNVCLERTEYKPVLFSQVVEQFKAI
jgi:calcineurin-like phosphoesterase family protein